MDYNNNEPDSGTNPVLNNNYYNTNQPNGMATAALVLGILAIISICCVYGSYLFGGIAITLGLLSRGKNAKLSTNALIGIILSIIGMVISTVIIVIAVISILFSYGSLDGFMQEYESYYEEIYGDDFPFDYDSFNFDYDSDYYNDDNSTTYDYDDNNQPIQPDLPNTLTITFK
jgi:hypothetical protein